MRVFDSEIVSISKSGGPGLLPFNQLRDESRQIALKHLHSSHEVALRYATMPWPLSSSKSRSRPASSASDSSAFPLDDSLSDRRSASLDLSRSGLSPLSAIQDSAKRDRRSSFPRLALPSWRSPAAARSPSEEDGDVELVSGHATPFSANGLRGGFAPDDAVLSSRSSSIRSGSIRSSYYNGDDQEDEEDGSLRTGGSSRTRVMVSPYLTPVDSGWSEFGPDSIVPEELDRPQKATKPTAAQPTNGQETALKEEGVPSAGKRRSRGWFSFSTTANGPPTPTSEDAKILVAEPPAEPSRVSAVHPAGQAGDAGDTQPKADKSLGASKASTPNKSKFTFPSRRRMNSELSMKDVEV